MPSPSIDLGRSAKPVNDEVDLLHYLHLITSHARKIAGLATIMTVIAIYYSLTLTSIYRSSVTILIEAQPAKALLVDEVVEIDSSLNEYFQTQFEILKSRSMVVAVVKKLDLTTHPFFDPRQKVESRGITSLIGGRNKKSVVYTEEQIFDRVVSQVSSKLNVTPISKTQIVKVDFESSDPKLAADICNAIAQAFIDYHIQIQVNVTQKAQVWLKSQLNGLKNNLHISELKLQAFREREDLVDVHGVKSIAKNELEHLVSYLITIRQEKEKSLNTYNQVKGLADKPVEELVLSPAILNQVLIQQLKAEETRQEVRLAEMSDRYGNKHPKIIAANSELISIRGRIHKQALDLVVAFKKEFDMNEGLFESVKKQIEVSKREVQRINRKSFELEKLIRDVESNRHLYELFLDREKETLGISGFQADHARVIDEALPSRNRVKPKKSMIVVMAFLLSIMVSIMIILMVDLLDNTIKSIANAEDKLHLPSVGLLPLVKKSRKQYGSGAYKGYIDDADKSFSEAVRTLRTRILLSFIGESSSIIMLTSSVPNEGKTTVAINLAAALGQLDKTLLIDADMRRPSLGDAFGEKGAAKGLSSVVSGVDSFEDCVFRDKETGLDVLLVGCSVGSSLELLCSKNCKDLLVGLKSHYRYIVIDTAPTLKISDSLVLATLVDHVFYIVKSNSTKIPLVKHGIKRIYQAGATISGVILNQVEVKQRSLFMKLLSPQRNKSSDIDYYVNDMHV